MNIPYGRQQITEEDIQAVTEALKSDFLTQGPQVDNFEKNFAKYVGAKYAVAVTNGTAALHLSALALLKNNNKKVLVAALTFAASANCILYANEGKETPVDFIDIDPKTYLMDFNLLEDKIKKNPNLYQGVVPVDFAGYPLALRELKSICDKYGLWILEDACHAPGANITEDGKKYSAGSGENSDLSIFSFHPVKHIATGEGGMITTQNEKLYEKLKILRTHGITKNPSDYKENSHGGWYHEMQLLGFNYRLPDLNAALGNSQLKRADQNLKRRLEIADRYDKELAKYDLVTPFRSPNIQHGFHLYIVQTENRKEFYEFLKTKNIYAQVHYLPVYWHPYYKELGFKKGLCPETEKYYSRCLSIPMYHGLTQNEQSYVIDSIGEYFNGK